MKKLLLLAVCLVLAAHHAFAKQSGTFVCTPGLSIPIDSFYLELPNSSSPGASASYLVSITTDVSQFPNLFITTATGKTFESCEIQITGKPTEPETLMFKEVSVQLVSVSADSQTKHVTATFHYSRVQLAQTNAAASAPSAPALTPDQQSKALTEFLARAPKPSAN